MNSVYFNHNIRCYAALSPKYHARELLIAAGFYYTHICSMRLYAVSEKTKTQIQAIIATEIINQSIKNGCGRKVSNSLNDRNNKKKRSITT